MNEVKNEQSRKNFKIKTVQPIQSVQNLKRQSNDFQIPSSQDEYQRIKGFFENKYSDLNNVQEFYEQKFLDKTYKGQLNRSHHQFLKTSEKIFKGIHHKNQSIVKVTKDLMKSTFMSSSFNSQSHLSSQLYSSNSFQQQIRINLENYAQLELLFSSMSKTIQSKQSIQDKMNQYWDLVFTLKMEQILSVITQEKLNQECHTALNLEIIAMSLLNFYVDSKIPVKPELQQRVILTVYQNFIQFGDILSKKLSQNSNTLDQAQKLTLIIQKGLRKDISSNKTILIKQNNMLLKQYIVELNQQVNQIPFKNRIQILNIEIFQVSSLYQKSLNLYPEVQLVREKLSNSLALSIDQKLKFNQYQFCNKLYNFEPADEFDDEELDQSDQIEVKQKEIPFPYLKNSTDKQYTLVLDLDETLVHYDGVYIDVLKPQLLLIRPGAREFIQKMSQNFEIVIFTAGVAEYAEQAVKILDTQGCISSILSRDHTSLDSNFYTKDISKLGRDLNKVIIVDNCAQNFAKNKENGIFIKSWIGDYNDTALQDLQPIFNYIVKNNVQDVKNVLLKYRDNITRLQFANTQQPHLKFRII